MAGRGPAPKPADQRRNRRADTIATSHLVDDGQKVGPELKDLTGVDYWNERTLRWFEVWRSSAQAKTFTSTDWQRLGMLADIVEAFFQKPSKALFEEIRLNEERFGATIVDRQRARMVIAPSENDSAPVLSIAPGSSARERIQKRAKKQ